MTVQDDINIRIIQKGDALTIKLGRNPHNDCVGLVEYEGRNALGRITLVSRPMAQTDERRGPVTVDMILIRVVRALIKDQLQ